MSEFGHFSDPRSPAAANDHYSSLAADYARFRPHYPDELLFFLSQESKAGHDLALDCACGSGQATDRLAPYYRTVKGVDISKAQLNEAKDAKRANITYFPGRAEEAGRVAKIEPRTVDLITVATAFHWLDIPSFCAEAGRLLKLQGVLAHWTYTSSVLTVDDPDLRAVVDRFVNKVAPFWPQEHDGSTHASGDLPPPYKRQFEEIKAPEFPLTVTRTLEQFLGYVGTWSAIPHYIEANGENPVDQLRNEIAPLWGVPWARQRASQILYLKVFRKKADF